MAAWFFVLWGSSFGTITAGVGGVLGGGGRPPACAPAATAPRLPPPAACCRGAALLQLRFEGDGLGPLQGGYLFVAQVLLRRAVCTAQEERDCMLSRRHIGIA